MPPTGLDWIGGIKYPIPDCGTTRCVVLAAVLQNVLARLPLPAFVLYINPYATVQSSIVRIAERSAPHLSHDPAKPHP